MVEDPVASYGVRDMSTALDMLDVHAEELRLVGYTVLDSGLSTDAIAQYRDRIGAIVHMQESEFGGKELIGQIGEANTGRALLAYDEAFLSLAANPLLIGLVQRMLGEFVILSQQNSILLEPGDKHNQAKYHRDLPYQHFTSSRPLAINALFCVDPFTIENGATKVIPGSHKYEPFPSEATVRRLERVAVAPAGSFIVLDAMVFHSAGRNRSNAIRHGVNHVFVLPFMRQQIDLPRMLNGKYADDPFLRKLLGYETQTPAGVIEWRQERLQKLT